MAARNPILVTGATGAQGGGVVDSLLQAGFMVRALVRDPFSSAAEKLSTRGVRLIKGDFDDPASLSEAVKDAAGVFSVQLPPMPTDLDSEVRTGKRLIAAAREAGVAIFVHSSVARAGDQQSFAGWSDGRWWPQYWNSKSAVNEAVKAAGFRRWVILKPAFMMDNFIPPKAAHMFAALGRGAIETAMTTGTRLDLVAASDIGRFAAAAFAEPERLDRMEIDLAAESLTMEEVAGILSRATGKQVVARSLTADEAIARGKSPGLVESQLWASLEGYKVDLDRARSHGIPFMPFAEWADRRRLDIAVGST